MQKLEEDRAAFELKRTTRSIQHEFDKIKRTDTYQEQRILIEQLNKEILQQAQQFSLRLGAATEAIAKLQQEHTECMRRAFDNEAKVSLLQGKVDLLEQEAIHRRVAPVETAFRVSATLDGTIISVSEEVRSILGYLPSELIGGNVTAILPADFHAKHNAGMERAKTGQRRPKDLAVVGEAQTRFGKRVSVIVLLDFVLASDGSTIMVAEVHDRTAAHVFMSMAEKKAV